MANEDVVKQAREMGWVPEEEFRGDKARWVSAEEFLEKAEHVLPLMKANNRRLKEELLTRDQKIGTLEQQLQNATVAIERLDKHYSESAKRQVAAAKKELLAQLKDARQEDDVEKEEEIQVKLGELRDAEKAALEKKEEPAPKKKDEVVDPDLIAWKEENPWFEVDKKKTKAIIRIAEDLREEGNTLRGRAFYEACAKELERQLGSASKEDESDDEPRASRVSSSPRRGHSSGGRSFADLPAEAKQACYDDVDSLVGPNKRFKTVDDWKKEYAKIYFGMGE